MDPEIAAHTVTFADVLNDNATAIIGVMGTLLGALIGFAGNEWTASRARRHADRTRFEDRRFEVFAEVIAVCRELNIAVRARNLPDGLERITETLPKVNRTLIQARLLGDDAVRKSVDDLYLCIVHAIDLARQDASQEAMRQQQAATIEVLRIFEAASTRCLGGVTPL